MSYVIELYGPTGSGVQDQLPSGVATVRGWSKRINAPGKLVFSMHKFHESASPENLRMWRHVRLCRKTRDGSRTKVPVWYGVIVAKREMGDDIEVLCHGALRIFTKRYTAASQNLTGQGSSEAFDLLSDTNSNDGATGISAGEGGVTTTLDLTLDSVQMLQAWERIAQATGAEFEIDDDGHLNFVTSIGSDKSSTTELIFQRNGNPGSDLLSIEIAEDGEPMANKIIGTTNNGDLTSTYTHPTSTPTYPVLIERKAFNEANDQTTLDALTESYGMQRGLPIPDFQAVPATAVKRFNPLTGTRTLSGIQYEDIEVGDLVTVTIVTPNMNTSVVKRVAEVIVDADENMQEMIRFTLTEAGVFVTERYLDDNALSDIKRSIQEIEQQL